MEQLQSHTKEGKPRCQKRLEKDNTQCNYTAQGQSKYCKRCERVIERKKAMPIVTDATQIDQYHTQEWITNHTLIKETYISLTKAKRAAPSIQDVADRIGLSYKTVWNHINDLEFEETVKISGVKILTERVLLGIANAAQQGSAQNAKLFFQLVYGMKFDGSDDGERGKGQSQTNIYTRITNIIMNNEKSNV